MDKQLKRVRLVTRHYRDLQGLRHALVGSVFTLVFGLYFIAEPPHGWAAIWIALAVAFALILPAERHVRRYYESTFGRVSSEPESGPATGAAAGAAMVVIGMIWDIPPPAVAFLIVAPFSLWIGIRDWPLRTYHLVPFAAAVTAVYLQKTAAAKAAPDLAIAAGFLLLGLSHVPVGFLDHQLLASTLKRREPQEADARTPQT